LKTKDGKILISTFKGIYIYNEEKDSFDKVLDKKDGILSDTVFSLSEDDYGNIWIGTDLGVNKISKDFKVLETYKSGESKSFLGDSNIYTICCDDKNNSVWVGTSDSGVYKINTKTKKIHKFKSNPHDENSLPSNKIYTILKDDKNNIWIGTDNGLTYYNKEKDNFNTYKNDPN
jgi:Predicted periplasmic ligand-binding sensor domain